MISFSYAWLARGRTTPGPYYSYPNRVACVWVTRLHMAAMQHTKALKTTPVTSKFVEPIEKHVSARYAEQLFPHVSLPGTDAPPFHTYIHRHTPLIGTLESIGEFSTYPQIF